MVLMCAHIFSCAFYAVGRAEGGEASWAAGVDDENLDSNFEKYIAAFYWSIMTITTVGYGDISAIGTQQRIISMVAMVVGAILCEFALHSSLPS